MQMAMDITTADLRRFAIPRLFIVHLRAVTRWLYSGDKKPMSVPGTIQWKCAGLSFLRKWLAKEQEEYRR
jgi:hypothetical protein